MKNSNNLKILVGFFLFSFILRFWDIGEIKHYRGDEHMHVAAAKNYVSSGHQEPDAFFHPPLKHVSLYLSIKAFGDNPYGWRMQNVILGALVILGTVLTTREFFPDMRVAYMAGLLLSIDPIHIFMSRATGEDIAASLFFLLALYFFARYIKDDNGLPLIPALFIGLSLSTKWFYLSSWIVLLISAMYIKISTNKISKVDMINLLAAFVFIPLTVYMLIFYKWFTRGYGLMEFIQMQVDSYRALQAAEFENPSLYNIAGPWKWFIMPVYLIQQFSAGAWGRYLFIANNPPVWLLTIPSLIFMSYRFLKTKDRFLFLVVMLFVSVYFQLFLASRPIFLYSAVSVLPICFIAISYFLISMLDKFRIKRGYEVLMAVIILWGLYLYPLVAAINVPVFLYKPLLYLLKIF